MAAARAFLDDFAQPEALTLHQAGPVSPDDTLRALCSSSIDSGVMPPCANAMRRTDMPLAMVCAETGDGDIAASGETSVTR